MSPTVRNLLLTTSVAAVVLGAVQILAGLPHHLHRAGIVAPGSWEVVLVQVLERK